MNIIVRNTYLGIFIKTKNKYYSILKIVNRSFLMRTNRIYVAERRFDPRAIFKKASLYWCNIFGIVLHSKVQMIFKLFNVGCLWHNHEQKKWHENIWYGKCPCNTILVGCHDSGIDDFSDDYFMIFILITRRTYNR